MGYPTLQQKKRVKPMRFDSKYVVSKNCYEKLSDEKLVEMSDDRIQWQEL